MENILRIAGRYFFAAGVAAIGIQQLIYGDFRPLLLPSWPGWMPGHVVLAYLTATGLLVAGLAILFGKGARQGAIFIGVLFGVLVLFFHIPFQASHNLYFLGAWGNAFKALAFCGGAFAVAGSLSQGQKIPSLARIFFCTTMIVFGIEHFVYTPFVDTLIPDWIPWHRFWTYFGGVALIAAGAAIILKTRARLAANLLGLMIFCWFVLLHLPRGIASTAADNGNEWTSVFEALAFSGIAFVLADIE
ncbi:MAG: hypothetical protein P4L51_12925 [Puia sp.]|nr:hypothetical protein [Puia sp.]